MGGFSILRLERSVFTIYNENASNYDQDDENIDENNDIDYNFVGHQVKKEGSQSAMRLCM